MLVLTDTGREYLERHAIDPLVLAQAGVTERDGRLILPNGRSSALNGHGPKVKQPNGVPLELWWLTGPPEDGATVLVCEGESDALAALSTIALSEMQHQGSPEDPLAGITVAAMPGTGYPVSRLAHELRNAGEVILAFDGDDAGRNATGKATDALRKAGISCHAMEMLDGHDVADCLAGHDPGQRPEWLAGRINDARLYTALQGEFAGVGQVGQAIGGGPGGPARYDGRIIDVQAMLAAPEEPLEWRCDGIAADGYLTVLTGRGKEGKTWLALALAAGVARGRPAAGIDCTEGRAMIFDAENGPRLLKSRWHAAAMTADLQVQPVDAGGLRFTEQRDMEWIRAVIDEHKPNLVVFDSLRIMSSGSKESDGDEMEPVITSVKTLARETGAAVILIHHRGKGESSYRGSSVILDQTDMMFALGRVEGDPEGATRRKIATVGCRIAEEPIPRWVEIKAGAAGLVFVSEADPFEGDNSRPRDELRDDVLGLLGGIPRSARNIAKAAGRQPDDSTVKRVLRDLERDGLASRGADGWTRVIGEVA